MKKKVFFSIILIGLAFTMQAQSWFTPGTVYQFESKSTSNPQEVITLRVIYDAQGRLIGKTGHGDSRYGRSSGSVRTPAQVQRTRPPADVEPIERTTTYGDQSSTIILLNNTEGTQVASAPVSSATQTQRPMQQNRGQLIAQYQSSLMLTSLNKVS